MIPLIKLLYITVKLFTKPTINIIKRRIAKREVLKRIFTRLGYKLHNWDVYINRKFKNFDEKVHKE